MKKKFPIGIGAMVCAVVIFVSYKPVPPPASTVTVFDTAIYMLQEFVIKGGDMNLGFASSGEVLNAHIDTADGIEMYYIREDSLINNQRAIDSQLTKLNRKIYPVYSGKKLCASVTFDSTEKGWQPLVFEDSTAVNAYLNDKAKTVAASPGSKQNYYIIVAPFLSQNLVVHHDSTGTQIVPTEVLKREMGETMPLVDIQPSTNPVHISINVFTNGLKKYIKKIEGRR